MLKKIKLKKKFVKYGKKISDIKKIKQEFFENNDKLLKSQLEKGRIYCKQRKRKNCKVCGKKINGRKINIRNITYLQCNYCSHLNGVYEDTFKFVNTIYSSKKINYSQKYAEKDKKNYISRVKNIYKAKVDFLKSNIKNIKNVKILDIGAGSGYFVSALKKGNIKNSIGIEVSQDQVLYGKKMLKSQKYDDRSILHVPFDKLENFLKVHKDYNCASFIGVIEHLQEMKKIVSLVSKNKKCELIFVSVPLYSLSTLIESNFPKVFNRHLGGSHTHLFTEKSIKHFFGKFNFTSHSEWWFGQDYNDLFRSMSVMSNKLKNTGATIILEQFRNLIDDFQLILDRKKMSSEVHILFKRKN